MRKKNYNRYKVNCSEISELMSRENGNHPATHQDMTEFFRILEKDMVDITEIQRSKISEIIAKTANYDPSSLSTTFKTSIYKHYSYAEYGAGKVSSSGNVPLSFDKGEIAEPEAVKFLSKMDGIEYHKNEKLYSNKYFKGIPDILLMEGDKAIGVKDIKICIDLPSFLARVDGDYLKDDAWEMRGYLDILNLREGEICYCLIDMPDIIKEKRLKEHKERMELSGYTPDHIKKALRKIEKSMTYYYVPDELRIKRFTVERKGYFTTQMHKKVKIARERLVALNNKFKNPLTLLETPED